MTVQREDAVDVFELDGSFPRPAWVVLDAARERRFTGELVFATEPSTTVSFDRGNVYLAERDGDPSLGSRLVDAGALNAAQLEHGALHVRDAEHLGRLFERTPSVDRQFVQIVTEMMNEACVAELARCHVDGVEVHPYRYHPSGVHHWIATARRAELQPGDPLPPPSPDDRPVASPTSHSLFGDVDDDALVRWDHPSWLDDRSVDAAPPAIVPSPSVLDSDWADRLDTIGLPMPDDDPLATPTPLPRVDAAPLDRFELIWPSGQVDEEFGATSAVHGGSDADRIGPTARIHHERRGDVGSDRVDAVEHGRGAEPGIGAGRAAGAQPAAATRLAVRRAVATVDVGSLDTRRRLVAVPADDDPAERSAAEVPPFPASPWSTTGRPSVFDDADRSPRGLAVAPAGGSLMVDEADEPERVSALRRLIGGLRRR